MHDSAKEYAEKFERLLEMYPRSDGARWRGVDFDRATNGFLSKGYITALRKGRMANPGIPKLKEIADLMGFPFRLWMETRDNWEMVIAESSTFVEAQSTGELASLINHLLDVRPNPRTGESYTNHELSRATGGELSADQIAMIRDGKLDNPTRDQLIALSRAFRVDPAYWFRREDNAFVFEPGTYEALKDNEFMLKRTLSLSASDKELVMSLLEKLEKAEEQELRERRGSEDR